MSEIVFGGNKSFVASKADVMKLAKDFAESSRIIAGDLDDVLVFLEPEGIPILEITCSESLTMFVCEPDETGMLKKIPVTNGQPFRASIACRPMKGRSRQLTEFHFDT